MGDPYVSYIYMVWKQAYDKTTHNIKHMMPAQQNSGGCHPEGPQTHEPAENLTSGEYVWAKVTPHHGCPRRMTWREGKLVHRGSCKHVHHIMGRPWAPEDQFQQAYHEEVKQDCWKKNLRDHILIQFGVLTSPLYTVSFILLSRCWLPPLYLTS